MIAGKQVVDDGTGPQYRQTLTVKSVAQGPALPVAAFAPPPWSVTDAKISNPEGRVTVPMQLLNNHVVYHGRTAYEDDAASHQERLLFRLWLSTPNSRRLPDGFETLWGSVNPGALRGGVVQPATAERVPA